MHVMTLPVRCERAFEGRVDPRVHTANSQVVLVGAQVLSNLRLVLLLVGDLNAEQDLKAIAELPPQRLNRLHSLPMGGQGCPHLAWVKVEMVGQRDPRHPKGDRQRGVDVEGHLRVRGEEGVQMHVEGELEGSCEC